MKLSKAQVADVVSEASKKMSDPNYSAVMVGGFVQRQAPTSQFISAHQSDLGGAEAVVHVIFHCALIHECFQRAGGRPLRVLSFEDLDGVAQGDTMAKLAKVQPSLHEYIESNVEAKPTQRLIALLALAMDYVS